MPMVPRASLKLAALVAASFVLGAGLLAPSPARAHCDTLDGPVVKDAERALAQGDVTPVLKWVREGDVEELSGAFSQAMAVRAQGPEAKALADKYFFETTVRLHRAGEGAPYEGLKPAGADLGPAVIGADRALESGSVDSLVTLLTDEVARGVRERFSVALERRGHAEESVEAGRKFVESYVEFVHYVEGQYHAAKGGEALHAEAESDHGRLEH